MVVGRECCRQEPAANVHGSLAVDFGPGLIIHSALLVPPTSRGRWNQKSRVNNKARSEIHSQAAVYIRGRFLATAFAANNHAVERKTENRDGVPSRSHAKELNM